MPRLTATQLADFFSCQRRAWFHSRLPASEKTPPDPLHARIMAAGDEYEKKVLETVPDLVRLSAKDLSGDNRFEELFLETLRVMREGAAAIHHGILLKKDPASGLIFLAEPDLLEKIPVPEGHTSPFGGHGYRIVEIKNSARLSSQHYVQLAMNAWLLENVQGFPTGHFLLDHHGVRTPFSLDEHRYFFENLLEACQKTLLEKTAPVFVGKPICPGCAWEGHCYREAGKNADLGLIHGITEKEIALLGESDMATLATLTSPEKKESEKAPLKRIPPDRLWAFTERARALVNGKSSRLKFWKSARERYLVHPERDLAYSKKWISFSVLKFSFEGGRPGKPEFTHTFEGGTEETIREFFTSTPLESIRLLRETDLRDIKEEILFPGANAKGESLQHLRSLESLLAETFALDIPRYELFTALGHLKFLPEGFVEPLVIWYETGSRDDFAGQLEILLRGSLAFLDFLLSPDLTLAPFSRAADAAP